MFRHQAVPSTPHQLSALTPITDSTFAHDVDSTAKLRSHQCWRSWGGSPHGEEVRSFLPAEADYDIQSIEFVLLFTREDWSCVIQVVVVGCQNLYSPFFRTLRPQALADHSSSCTSGLPFQFHEERQIVQS